jgi:hypothetical protein
MLLRSNSLLANTGRPCMACNDSRGLISHEAPRALSCHQCSRAVARGDTLYFCRGCNREICPACLGSPSRRGSSEAGSSETLGKAEVPVSSDVLGRREALGGGGAVGSSEGEAVLPDAGESKGISVHQQKLPTTEIQARAAAEVLTSVQKLMSQRSMKFCESCHQQFSGFGFICPNCRRQGPGGSIRQCVQCTNYFQGYGESCRDCDPAPQQPTLVD